MRKEDFMPLCAPDNRAKSWSSEHCHSWTIKDVDTCKLCFWANPTNYTQVETRPERRLTLIFQGKEVEQYDHLKELADPKGKLIQRVAIEVLDL